MMNLTIVFFKIYIIDVVMTSSAILHETRETFIWSHDKVAYLSSFTEHVNATW